MVPSYTLIYDNTGDIQMCHEIHQIAKFKRRNSNTSFILNFFHLNFHLVVSLVYIYTFPYFIYIYSMFFSFRVQGILFSFTSTPFLIHSNLFYIFIFSFKLCIYFTYLYFFLSSNTFLELGIFSFTLKL